MRNRKRIDQKGFTLLETMVALGLSVLVILAIFVFYTSFNKQIVQLSDETEIATDLESGQRILLRDLKQIDTSFGVITVSDDSGKPFFDYYPDVPEADIAAPASRTITLKQNGTKELVVILHDHSASSVPMVTYDPSWAFQVTPASAFAEGTVVYKHVNGAQAGAGGHGNMISVLRPAETVSGKVIYPGFWNKGQLLMFDMPAAFRLPSQMGQRNQFAPRPPFFIGRVTGAAVGSNFPLDAETAKFVNTSHPLNSSYNNNTPGAFLWGLPSTAGGMPVVRLRPVKLVKYKIEQMYPDHRDEKMRLLVRLYRHVLTEGAWNPNKNKFMLAEKLKSVQFRRNSVTDKAVLFEISRSEL